VQCLEAVREKRGAEQQNGLSTMLGEASTGTLHSSANDRLRRCFDDTRADRVVLLRCLGILHPAEFVLRCDVGRSRVEFFQGPSAIPFKATSWDSAHKSLES